MSVFQTINKETISYLLGNGRITLRDECNNPEALRDNENNPREGKTQVFIFHIGQDKSKF